MTTDKEADRDDLLGYLHCELSEMLATIHKLTERVARLERALPAESENTNDPR